MLNSHSNISKLITHDLTVDNLGGGSMGLLVYSFSVKLP